MNTELNTLIAAMTAEEKVALLTGSGLWRTASCHSMASMIS